MVNRKEQKKRGVPKYKRRKLILIGVEGDNKTEKQYFNHFNRLQGKYSIRFANGNETDPINIVENIKKAILKAGGDSFGNGDYAFAVFDTDVAPEKEQAIAKAKQIAKGTGIKLVLSNPCFEVWFVLHFECSSAAYPTSDHVIKKLRTFISNYEKNEDVYNLLENNIESAIEGAEYLRKTHINCGNKKIIDQNPMTDVDVIIKKLI